MAEEREPGNEVKLFRELKSKAVCDVKDEIDPCLSQPGQISGYKRFRKKVSIVDVCEISLVLPV